MTDTSLIDTELDQFPLPVESSKVREFALALLDDDPIYQDARAARAPRGSRQNTKMILLPTPTNVS